MKAKRINEAIDKAAAAAKKLTGKLEETGAEAREAVDTTVERVQSQVTQSATKGEHRVNETVERAAHRVQEKAHELAHRAEEFADKLSSRAKRAASSLGRTTGRDPDPQPGQQAEPSSTDDGTSSA